MAGKIIADTIEASASQISLNVGNTSVITATANAISFPATAQRITGDFSNATVASRVMFQTSTANTNTSIGALANGTATQAAFSAFNANDPTNASSMQIVCNTSESRLAAERVGTGTYLPMTFYTGGSERMRVDTSGNMTIKAGGSTITTHGFYYNENGGEIQLYDETGTTATLFDQASNNTRLLELVNGSNLVLGLGFSNTTGLTQFMKAGYSEAARIDSNGNVLVTNPAGLGYGTGSGGTVTQATNKSTAVALNKPTGQITMNNAALAAGAEVFFFVTNTLVTTADNVIVTPLNGAAAYTVRVYNLTAGGFAVGVKNVTGGSLSDALQINFAVIKGATS